MGTVEAIEVLLLLVATAAGISSALLLWRAFDTLRYAAQRSAQQAVVELARLRARNEAIRLLGSLLIVGSALVQLSAPEPLAPTAARPYLQVAWVLVAVTFLCKSLLNEWTIRRVIRLLEREDERRG